jgi:hypothetical protein
MARVRSLVVAPGTGSARHDRSPRGDGAQREDASLNTSKPSSEMSPRVRADRQGEGPLRRNSYATRSRDVGRRCRCPEPSVRRESTVIRGFVRPEVTQRARTGSWAAYSRIHHRGRATYASRDGTTLVIDRKCTTRCSEQSRRKVVAQSYGATATQEGSPRLPGRQRHQHRMHGAMSGGPFFWPFEETHAPREHRTQLRSEASPRPSTNAARMSP